jgi:hypothetical protein
MAKRKHTRSKTRRATVAKVTKAPSNRVSRNAVQWGYENGQQIVIRATGRWSRDLPADRWRGLRDTINDMGDVVKAFDATRDIADADQRLTMLSMSASVARALMLQADDNMRAVLALSPALRSTLATVDARMGKGGAQ